MTPAIAQTNRAKLLATKATAPPVLVDEGVELEPVGDPPLPPTEGLLEVVDALLVVADRVALLMVVLRAMLAPVPDAPAAVPASVVVVALAEAVATAVEFFPPVLPPPMTPPELSVELADADVDEAEEASVDEAEAEEVEPPVTVIMPV